MTVRAALLVWAVLLASASAQGVGAASLPSPTSVEASLRRDGPKGAVDALRRSDRWGAVEDGMGRGDARWIALAPRLAPGTDAGTSEGLGIALAHALPRNPRAVLAVLGVAGGPVSVSAGRVCGVPFIEDTVKDLTAYRRRAARAVRGVTDPSLVRARGACLSVLAES